MAQPREDARIQCLECGRWFRALPSHLRHAHGYSDEDYRLKYRIPVGTPLVCREWSKAVSRANEERDSKRTLKTAGPPAGYAQRESVRAIRSKQYARLAIAGTAAAAGIDRTEARRLALAPYPVSVDQAAERLGCTMSAAYTFLSFCVQAGRLRRIRRGLYDSIPEGI